MEHPSSFEPNALIIGIDVSDKTSRVCVMSSPESVVQEVEVGTSPAAFDEFFSALPASTVILETGTHSMWIGSALEKIGHRPRIVDARDPRLRPTNKKNDRMDARKLAGLGFLPNSFLSEVRFRPPEFHRDLAVIRARDELVKARTLLINSVRGLVKPLAHRFPKLDSETFHEKALRNLPKEFRPIVLPMLKSIREVTRQIAVVERKMARMANRSYPQTRLLTQVYGVGPVTALAFILTLWDPRRFKKSRQVGAYLGLVPRLDESGEYRPQLGITKAGDALVRRLLIQCAHTILRKNAPDSDLKNFGLALSTRGGKNARKRAVVAIARRLAGILHRLWRTAEVYNPYYSSRPHAMACPN